MSDTPGAATGAVRAVLRAEGLAAFAPISAAHIGLDRALGHELEHPSAFGDTHLGRIGRRPAAPLAGRPPGAA